MYVQNLKLFQKIVNNLPSRHCKMHKILFPKTKLKRIKLIKTVFLKT